MACLFPMHFCELDYTLSCPFPVLNNYLLLFLCKLLKQIAKKRRTPTSVNNLAGVRRLTNLSPSEATATIYMLLCILDDIFFKRS